MKPSSPDLPSPSPAKFATRSVDASPAARFTARRHETIDDVAPLWERLQRGGVSTVYQQISWARAVARHLLAPAKAELALMEIVDETLGEPIMLLPLVRKRARFHSTIEFLDLGVCDYAAPLVAPGVVLSPAETAAVWSAVRSALPKSDFIHIRHLAHRVGGEPNPLAGLASARRMEMQAFGVAIDGDPATVMKRTCSASILRDLRKAGRRMADEGEVRFVVASTVEESEELFATILRQRLERFGELGRFDLLNRPEVRAFYRDASSIADPSGPVRMFGIKVGEEWIASAYGLVHDGAFHGTLLAMAGQNWRRCSPGLTIVSEIMVWARSEGLTYLDFTVGDMPYKASFGVEARDLFEIVESLTLRGRIVTDFDRGRSHLKLWTSRHPRLFETLRKGIQWYRRQSRRKDSPS